MSLIQGVHCLFEGEGADSRGRLSLQRSVRRCTGTNRRGRLSLQILNGQIRRARGLCRHSRDFAIRSMAEIYGRLVSMIISSETAMTMTDI